MLKLSLKTDGKLNVDIKTKCKTVFICEIIGNMIALYFKLQICVLLWLKTIN